MSSLRLSESPQEQSRPQPRWIQVKRPQPDFSEAEATHAGVEAVLRARRTGLQKGTRKASTVEFDASSTLDEVTSEVESDIDARWDN